MFRFVLLLSLCAFLVVGINILDPKLIRDVMYTEEITGIPNIAVPDTNLTSGDIVVEQTYTVTMKKSTQKMLPGNYPETPIYAYSAQTQNGYASQFPGPAIIAYSGVSTKIKYVNEITGKHMLPIDYSEPFLNQTLFHNQVPVIPHLHGLPNKVTSDGQPMNYWTALGNHSANYKTQEPCQKNEAVFTYTNEEGPGLNWYHDHTYGITRQNVYAGLAALYEVVDQQISYEERRIREIYNNGEQIQKLYFAIGDRSFKTDGTLYYPDQAFSSEFTSWIPEFFGNMMTVNGKVWPKLNLQKQKYRFIFLNGCNSRYINIYFMHLNKKIPFELIRTQSDYFPNPVITSEFLISPGARVQFLLDLTQVNGVIMVKNNAAAPYPLGNPQNLIDEFTGSLMKINMQSAEEKSPLIYMTSKLYGLRSLYNHEEKERSVNLKLNTTFPAFPPGQKVFATLSQHVGDDGEVFAMFINGISMKTGESCNGSTYKNGKVYDFYVINLTPDTHPMHFHLVNFQKVKSFPFDAGRYEADFLEKNGPIDKRGYDHMPDILDPEQYRTGNDIPIKGSEKVFRDVIDAPPDTVTVLRVSFTLKDGKDFSFDVKGSRYVWHCHMLEHEDNEMMIYFCLQ